MGKKVRKNFLMGLKIWWSWGSGFFFSKSPNKGRFSIFHAKLQFLRGCVLFLGKKHFFHGKLRFLGGWMLFLSKKTTIFRYFLENEGGQPVGTRRHPCVCRRRVPAFSASLWMKWNEMMMMKWNEMMKWSKFLVFDFYVTFSCYREVLILNFYIS